MISALTLAFSALVAGATWASPAARPDERGAIVEPLEATVVSRHRHPIMAQAWVGATMYRLGIVPPREQRTFDLPPAVTPGVTYHLVADCADAHRIMSEAITAATDARPRFTVNLSQETSFLRFDN